MTPHSGPIWSSIYFKPSRFQSCFILLAVEKKIWIIHHYHFFSTGTASSKLINNFFYLPATVMNLHLPKKVFLNKFSFRYINTTLHFHSSFLPRISKWLITSNNSDTQEVTHSKSETKVGAELEFSFPHDKVLLPAFIAENKVKVHLQIRGWHPMAQGAIWSIPET